MADLISFLRRCGAGSWALCVAGIALSCLVGCTEPQSPVPETGVQRTIPAEDAAVESGPRQSGPDTSATLPAIMVHCAEPRPEICTREFRPVCALREANPLCKDPPCEGEDKPEREWITRPNACEACADPRVIGHRPGSCEEERPVPRTLLDYR